RRRSRTRSPTRERSPSRSGRSARSRGSKRSSRSSTPSLPPTTAVGFHSPSENSRAALRAAVAVYGEDEQPMKLSMKPAHLKRYKDIVALFWTYGRSDVARDLGAFDETADRDLAPREGDPKPEQLADDLERMGPTYV